MGSEHHKHQRAQLADADLQGLGIGTDPPLTPLGDLARADDLLQQLLAWAMDVHPGTAIGEEEGLRVEISESELAAEPSLRVGEDQGAFVVVDEDGTHRALARFIRQTHVLSHGDLADDDRYSVLAWVRLVFKAAGRSEPA